LLKFVLNVLFQRNKVLILATVRLFDTVPFSTYFESLSGRSVRDGEVGKDTNPTTFVSPRPPGRAC
jgi:hypothetical protein